MCARAQVERSPRLVDDGCFFFFGSCALGNSQVGRTIVWVLLELIV